MLSRLAVALGFLLELPEGITGVAGPVATAVVPTLEELLVSFWFISRDPEAKGTELRPPCALVLPLEESCINWGVLALLLTTGDAAAEFVCGRFPLESLCALELRL